MARRDLNATLAAAAALLARAKANMRDFDAEYAQALAGLRAASTPYERGVALEGLARSRLHRFGGFKTFAAFLKAEGISRTTAHRLRAASRHADAETVATHGAYKMYVAVRAAIATGELDDHGAIARAVRARLRRLGVPLAKVTIVEEHGRYVMRAETPLHLVKQALARWR